MTQKHALWKWKHIKGVNLLKYETKSPRGINSNKIWKKSPDLTMSIRKWNGVIEWLENGMCRFNTSREYWQGCRYEWH